MRIFLFSDEPPTPDDADFIEAMLGMFAQLQVPARRPRRSQKINKLYSDDVLKLARELDLSVESTIEVMNYKRKSGGVSR